MFNTGEAKNKKFEIFHEFSRKMCLEVSWQMQMLKRYTNTSWLH